MYRCVLILCVTLPWAPRCCSLAFRSRRTVLWLFCSSIRHACRHMWRSGMHAMELYVLALLPCKPSFRDFHARHVTCVLPMSISLLIRHVTYLCNRQLMHCVNQHASSFFLCVSLQCEQQHLKVTTCVAKPVHTSRKVVTYASVTPCIMHRACSRHWAVVCFCKYKSRRGFRYGYAQGQHSVATQQKLRAVAMVHVHDFVNIPDRLDVACGICSGGTSTGLLRNHVTAVTKIVTQAIFFRPDIYIACVVVFFTLISKIRCDCHTPQAKYAQ